MSTTPNNDARTAALLHIAGMLLAMFGSAIMFGLNIIVPLVLMLVVGKKGEYLNDQIREVLRFQLLTTVYTIVAAIVAMVLVATVPDLMIIGFAVITLLGIIFAIMPIRAAFQLLKGKTYAYRWVFSPRRKAYEAEKAAS